ncbi:MAG: hypothetical protein II979_03305, partial [Clostridia bacterium]|nr:hypothetical protein [Clostridia bacterium]
SRKNTATSWCFTAASMRFCERTDEAEWSAEFEYPDPAVHTVHAVLSLSKSGKELLELIQSEK